MPNPVSYSLKCFPGNAASSRTVAQGTATHVELYFGVDRIVKVELLRIKLLRVSGGAANFTPVITSDSSAASAGGIAQEWVGTATAVGTLFDPVVSGAFMETDADGKLYLLFEPDAGVDNVFDYKLRFRVHE